MNALLVILLAQAAVTPAVSPVNDALQSVLVALSTVVTGLITVGGAYLVAWIRAKAASDKATDTTKAVSNALVMVSDAATVGARVAWETYTKAIKDAREDGALTPAEIAVAKQRAKDAAINALGQKGMDAVSTALGVAGLDAVIDTHLENAYASVKETADATVPQ
jgi:uncharacterized membrane protein